MHQLSTPHCVVWIKRIQLISLSLLHLFRRKYLRI